jgi:hypothetical protein
VYYYYFFVKAAYDTSKAKSQAPFEYPSLYSAHWPRLTQPPGPWRTWSEGDCENFEKGSLEHGKYFWKIRRDFVILLNLTLTSEKGIYSCQIEWWAKLSASITVGRRQNDLTFGEWKKLNGINSSRLM